jgi:hypothetical protein
MPNEQSPIEAKLERYRHRLELVRTIVPCMVLIMQVLIFVRLFHII